LEALLSLVLALTVLLGLFTGFFLVTVALVSSPAASETVRPAKAQDPTILVVWLGVCLIYLLVALRRMFFAPGSPLGEAGARGMDAEVLQALDEVTSRLHTCRPKVRIVDQVLPNVRSFGISPRFGQVQMSRALVAASLEGGGRDALQAVLAHELVHLRLFDTFFFTVIGPPLAIAKGVLGFLWRLRAAVGQGGQGGNAGPLVMFGLLGSGNPIGCLVTLFAIMLLISCLMAMLFYVGWLVLALMVMVAVCLSYSRFVERRADLRAVQALGSVRGMLDAMGAVLPGFPGEMARVHRYANAHLSNVQQYSMDDLLGSLAAGGNPYAGVSAMERLFRSHPPFMCRLAYLSGAVTSASGGST
jgi:Zn-dependent protease with chaperone function